MHHVLNAIGLDKSYDASKAIDGVTLSLPANTYVSVLGPSGSGKTTLLRLIAGFEKPDRGSIEVAGVDVSAMPPHRRGIGFVFQNFALFPHLSVSENIAFGLKNGAGSAMAAGTVARKVADMMELVGLSGLGERAVTQISGGQRQRVALARTLVTEPGIVLLDEPLGALDANLRLRMRYELRSLQERIGVTFLHVTGSETEALAMGEQVIVLNKGRIEQAGRAAEVHDRPCNPEVAHFLNCYNLFEGQVAGSSFHGSHGTFGFGQVLPSQGRSAYAIRQDRIQVRAADRPAGADEEMLTATFVASEYMGSSVLSIFSLGGHRTIEVEAHLSHAAPQEFVPHQPYALVWKRQNAFVYA